MKAAMSTKEMAAEMISATRDYIARTLKPYEDRIAELERRAPIPGKDGRDGKDGIGRDGKDGKDVDFDAVVEAVVKRIPIPKDGRDGVDGKDGNDAVGIPGRDGKDGINGKDADPVEVERLVLGHVQRAVSGLPVPRDGRDGRDGSSVSVEAVEALVRAEVVKAASTIPAGKDGKDAPAVDVDSVIAEVVKRVPVPKDGKDAQPIDVDSVIAQVVKRIPVPKDGQDGKSITIDDVTPLLEAEVSKWELQFERRAFDKLQKAVDRLPIPKDGTDGRDGIDGKDGVDGFGFDDFDIEYDGKRTFTFKWTQGEREVVKSFRAPINIYRGVFKAAERFEKDDTATYGGSLWIAMRDDPGTPGHGDGWKLAVKKGSDGKDSK